MSADTLRLPFSWPLEPASAEWAAIALIRLLFATDATEAERAWAQEERMEQARGSVTGRRWYQLVHADGSERWILVDDTFGRYSRQAPSDGERRDSPVIRVELSGDACDRSLRDYLGHLLTQQPGDSGLGKHAPALSAAIAQCEAGTARTELSEALRNAYCEACREAARAGAAASPPAQLASAFAQHVCGLHASFRLDGTTAAELLLLAHVLIALDPPPPDLVEAMAHACGEVLGPAVLQYVALDPARRQALLDACDALDAQGRAWLKTLAQAQHTGEHRGATLCSMPFHRAARQGCRFLADHRAVPAGERKAARSLSVGYEEELVVSRTCLTVDFRNALDGSVLRGHRLRIAEERRSAGDRAAETLWLDYHLRKRLYPAWWRPYFMGEAESVSEWAAAADAPAPAPAPGPSA